jgi:hypothetical protein
MTSATLGCEVWVFIAMITCVLSFLFFETGITLRLFEAACYFYFQLLSIFIAEKINSYLFRPQEKVSVEFLNEYVNCHKHILQ